MNSMANHKETLDRSLLCVPSLHSGPARSVRRRGGRPAFFLFFLLILSAGLIGCTSVSPYAPSAGPDSPSVSPIAPSAGPTAWEDIRTGLTTPEIIGEYFDSSPITYKGEKPNTFNHTQQPEETIRLRTGDCEDFAALITDALLYHGYEAEIISVEAKTSSGLIIHAVAVYRDADTGQWHYIHAYRYRGFSIGVSKGFDSQADMASTIAKKMNGRLYQYFAMSPTSFAKVYDAMLN
jgi:hypothetical protein